ncbi:hypothetical protein AB1K70_26000 [Bremerella sp. JC770]|uniref:hypothetical protein n=1 Tax=Bremerella sp. JC770 TaxID=3232137 RepID=UPI003458D1F2
MENAAPSPSPPKPPSRKHWFRFSISTLLLGSVIVALAVSHWTSARDRVALERKLVQIRQDHDLLEITDPDKIHVLPLPSPFHRTGQIRVHLPEGSRYLLKFNWRHVPRELDVNTMSGREEEPHMPHPGKELRPDTYLIEYAIEYMPMQGSGRWIVHVTAKSNAYEENIYAPLSWEAPNWLEAESVGNRDFRLTIDDSQYGIYFWDESGLEEGQVTLIDDVDEVTLVQTGVYNQVRLLGTLVHDPITTDDVFRIWIEKVPPQR